MLSMPTALLTPCGGGSGAGRPATPAGPKSQSGMATPGWRTSGVKSMGRSSRSMSIYLFSFFQAERPLFGERTRRIARWQHRGSRPAAAPDAAIDEAGARHLLWLVDVAAIDQYGLAHRSPDLAHVQRFKLVPVCDDNQRVGAFRDLVGALAKGHSLHLHSGAYQGLAPGLHRDRIVDAHGSALARNPADNIDGRSLAHVVGVGFQSQAEDANDAVAQGAEDVGQLGDDQAALVVVDLHDGVQHLGMQPGLLGHVRQRGYVFGEAVVADKPRCCDQRSRACLHAVDRRLDLFMLDLAHGQRGEGAVSLVAVRLNMALVASQQTLDTCAPFVPEGVFERGYLFVTADSQDIRLLL